MAVHFQRTKLWTSAFSYDHDDDDASTSGKDRLIAAYHSFRERAILLAGEIPQDLREFTQHDASHIDALWDAGDVVVGSVVKVNPLETFILGCAFLIHDLGMGVAALPDGVEGLKNEDGWRDILANAFRTIRGIVPTSDELNEPPSEIIELATKTALRENHAARADNIAFTSWTASGGATYHLIEDVDLRSRYGHLIGKIAASHGKDLDTVAGELPADLTFGASGDFPPEWTIEPLKLACIMRLADACQIDSRRAPGFLQAIRNPKGISKDHWDFQARLNRPHVEADSIAYTSTQPFLVDQAAAWWLCFETVQYIDRELAAVDALLLHKRQQRMAIRRVRGAGSPGRLAELIPVSGWTPVDARVVISNVPKLVRSLGGENLYGEDLTAPLRELIQNGADACRALRCLVPGGPRSAITVSVEQERAGDWWLTVSDNGIGMSQIVMASVLLDFGRTFWGSELMRHEVPGLAASTFSPTGKFGIGFYSVFMLGDEVKVVSRRYDEASSSTRVLEFVGGVGARPILRPARSDEVQHSGGTAVSVKLRVPFRAPGGLLGYEEWHKESLARYCAWLAPALDVDLFVKEEHADAELAVTANDWRTVDPVLLLRRLYSPSALDLRWSYFSITDVARHVSLLEQDGVTVGRAALLAGSDAEDEDGSIVELSGVATCGGLRVRPLSDICGIFEVRASQADRAAGELLASDGVVQSWASTQLELCEYMSDIDVENWMMDGPARLAKLGVTESSAKICAVEDEFLDAQCFKTWACEQSEILAVSMDELHIDIKSNNRLDLWDRFSHQRIKLKENVVVVPDAVGFGSMELVDPYPDQRWRPIRTGQYGGMGQNVTPHEWWYFKQRTPNGLIIRYITEAWGCTLEDLITTLEVFKIGKGPSVANPTNKRAKTLTLSAEWRITTPR